MRQLMPHPLCLEYPGAICQVMNRGDHRGTTVRLKWIAGELRMGNWTHLSNHLSKTNQHSTTQ